MIFETDSILAIENEAWMTILANLQFLSKTLNNCNFEYYCVPNGTICKVSSGELIFIQEI